MVENDREDQLRDRQDSRVYSLGRALRSTFDAENHDTLGSDVTGLMIDLSRVPYGDEQPVARTPVRGAVSDIAGASAPMATAPTPSEVTVSRRSWRDRLGMLLGGRTMA